MYPYNGENEETEEDEDEGEEETSGRRRSRGSRGSRVVKRRKTNGKSENSNLRGQLSLDHFRQAQP